MMACVAKISLRLSDFGQSARISDIEIRIRSMPLELLSIGQWQNEAADIVSKICQLPQNIQKDILKMEGALSLACAGQSDNLIQILNGMSIDDIADIFATPESVGWLCHAGLVDQTIGFIDKMQNHQKLHIMNDEISMRMLRRVSTLYKKSLDM